MLQALTWLELAESKKYRARVTARDIINSGIPPLNLAFLNCCSSGATPTKTLFGNYSISDAFHDSGTTYCISNRKPVKDKVAELFATTFYTHLGVNQNIPWAFDKTWTSLRQNEVPLSEFAGYELSQMVTSYRE